MGRESKPRGRQESQIATGVFAVAALAAAAVLFLIVSRLTFLQDEWAFIGSRREFNLQVLLKPYNEHWSSIPILIYQTVFRTRGLSSYGILAAAAALAHVFAASMLYCVLRSRARPILALAGGIGLLCLAWSDEVLLWPFSMGFTLAVGLGLAAILAWDRSHSSRAVDALGAVAMVAALASAGVALVFLVVASGLLLARRAPLSRLVWPAACVAAYACWFVTFGSAGVREGAGIDIAAIPPFVASGLASLAAPLLGLDYRFRLVSVIALAALVGGAVAWLQYRDARFWITFLGLVAFYALIATARAASAEPEAAQAPRYIYPAAALAFLALIPLIEAVARKADGQGRRLLWIGLVVWLVIALAGDAGKLVQSANAYAARAREMRALMGAVQVLRPVLADTPAASVVLDRRFFGGMTPSGYYQVIDDLTPLVSRATVGWLMARPPEQRMAVDRLIEHLLHDGLIPRLSPSAPRVEHPSVAARLGNLHDVIVEEGVSSCAELFVTGSDPFFSLQVAPNERVWIRTDGQRVVQVFARVVGDVFEKPAISFYPRNGSWYDFEPSPLPSGLAWTLRLDPPPGSGSFDICTEASAADAR